MTHNPERERFRDEVRTSSPILAVVQEYCTVKKAGAAWKACCPFPGHDEKTPSFHIYEADGRVWCYGCKRGGDVFNFIMEMESLDFPDALRHLADRAGLKMPEFAPSTRRLDSRGHDDNHAPHDRDGDPYAGDHDDDDEFYRESRTYLPRDLHAALQFAVEFYQAQLHEADGVHAREYLVGRKLTDETLATFQIGWSPDAWDTLTNAARKAGFGDDLLVAAGLAKQRTSGKGVYDWFRGRVMFPIFNPSGRAVGFGARFIDYPGREKRTVAGYRFGSLRECRV
jgi:DNA primase